MLCLDMKLVSRLRGTASSSTTNTSSSTHPMTSSISSASSAERNKSRKPRRESGEVAVPITVTSDSEEELLRPGYSSVQEMIRRNRSRSVCVAALLPSSQLRQLHRRASHVYVILTRLICEVDRAESSNELLTLQSFAFFIRDY